MKLIILDLSLEISLSYATIFIVITCAVSLLIFQMNINRWRWFITFFYSGLDTHMSLLYHLYV
ncbi:Uncharacterised protein [Klebsiella pneumoniae]|nr:Uncharacterised protein [Klebsiella pneumoniae]